MAAMIASKSLLASKLLEKLLFYPARTLAARSISSYPGRFFTTSAQMHDLDDEVDHADRRALSRRAANEPFPSFFSEVFDPFYPPRTLSQVLNTVDQLMDSPARGMGGGLRRGWDAKDDADGLYLRFDMPGLGKEDVKVTVEQNTLVIRGEESEKDAEGEDSGRGKYRTRIDLPAKVYESEQIRAEMKNGVLKVFVPKVKEKNDVVEVNIE